MSILMLLYLGALLSYTHHSNLAPYEYWDGTFLFTLHNCGFALLSSGTDRSCQQDTWLCTKEPPCTLWSSCCATYFASNSPGTGPVLSTCKFIPLYKQLLFFPHIAGYCSFSTSGPEPRATNQSVCYAGLSAKFLPILLLFSSEHAFPKACSSVD